MSGGPNQEELPELKPKPEAKKPNFHQLLII